MPLILASDRVHGLAAHLPNPPYPARLRGSRGIGFPTRYGQAISEQP